MLLFLSFWEIIGLIFTWYLAVPIIFLTVFILAVIYITLSVSLERIVKKINSTLKK